MPQSIIGTINQWEQSNLEIFPPSRIYNVLIGTNLNPSGFKFAVVGNTKLEGNVEITGNLSAVIQTLKVIEKTDDNNYLLTFISSTGNQIPFYANSQITYNPFTNKLTVGNITSDLTTSTGYLSLNLVGLIQNTQLENSYITIGTRLINLGDIITSISGMSSITSTNFYGLIDKIVVNNSVYNGDLKIVFSDGSNNLLDNAGLLYQPNNRILKVESNNSQTYQLLLKNSGQSAGIQIKGAPAVTQYEANITHYLDVLKIQNTGSDTEIEQVGIGTIRIFNLNGSLTLNSSGNIIASGIYAGNGSLLTSLTTANLNGLVQNTQLENPYIRIGTRLINLGDTITSISGLSILGIGINNPQSTLHILGLKATTPSIRGIHLGEDSTDGNQAIELVSDTGNYCYLDFTKINSDFKCRIMADVANGNLGFHTGSTYNERLSINSAGNVGIGISNPLTKLHIGNSANAFQLTIDGANAYPLAGFLIGGWTGNNDVNKHTIQSSNNLHIDSSDNGNLYMNYYSARDMFLCFGGGNVGIGNVNPTAKLHVSSADGYIQKWDSTSSNSFLYHDSTSTEIGTNSATDLILSAYSQKMTLQQGTGNLGIGLTNPTQMLHVYKVGKCIGLIQGTTDSAYTSTTTNNGTSYFGTDGVGLMDIDTGATIVASSGAKNIYIAPGLSAKMTIRPDGNVGIGLTTPSHKLDVSGKVFSNNGFYTPPFTSSGNYYFGTEYLNYILAGMEIEHTTLTGNYSQKVHFRTHHFAISNGRRMTIDENGNVGIGVINPSYQLHLSVDSAGKPNGGLWSNSSDIRIKQNVTNITKNQLFSIAKNYNTKHFKYKESYRKAHKLEDRFYFGVIANEIKEYMPCCITENELKYKIGEDEDGKDIYEVIEDCLTYNGTELQYVLLGCIPHLINENEHLKKEIDELKENQKKIIQKLNSIINPDGWFMNSI